MSLISQQDLISGSTSFPGFINYYFDFHELSSGKIGDL